MTHADPVRVAHINTQDRGGGAARVATQLADGLSDQGIASQLYVGHRLADSEKSQQIEYYPGEQAIARQVAWYLGIQDALFPSSWRLLRSEWLQSCSIVHLHNLHGGYFALPSIAKLAERTPLVWTVHDLWPITGKCVYPVECERWRTGCGHCPQLTDYPSTRLDTTALLFRYKRRLFRRVHNMTFIAPSRWVRDQIQTAGLPSRIVHIPHGIDTDVFHPVSKAVARDRLGLPRDIPLLLFVAAALDEPRKGMGCLLAALEGLDPSEVSVVAVGNVNLAGGNLRQVTVAAPGYVASAETLALYYSAADLFVNPTLSETAGLTNVEAMACGTPVVAFRSGAVGEYVLEGRTGVLVDPGDIRGLRAAISRLLENQNQGEYRARCAEYVRVHFGLDLFIRRHLDLYESVMV